MNESTNFLEFESQLLMLDHEILMLKFKAQEANPVVMTECYRYVNALRDQYKSLESRLQTLRKAKGKASKEQYAAMNDALRELDCMVGSIGMRIRIQYADSFSGRYPG